VDGVAQTPNNYGVEEQCDGNTISCSQNGYAGLQQCKFDCSGYGVCILSEYCGDGISNGNEACDSGMIGCTDAYGYPGTKICLPGCFSYGECLAGDGYCGDTICHGNDPINCPQDCDLPYCGDEICQQNDPASCPEDCVGYLYCGDGVVHNPNSYGLAEQCDDGANGSLEDQCTDSCELTVCGDEVIQSPNGEDVVEQCDDGLTGSSLCTSSCELTTCGDGAVQSPNGEGIEEQCDSDSISCIDANGYNGTETCNTDCLDYDECIPDESCGDGDLNGNEVCDSDSISCTDANGYRGTKSCSVDCFSYDEECIVDESCGDGNLNGSEECDDGPNGSSLCTPSCKFTICSDGVIQTPNGVGVMEQCDGIAVPSTCSGEGFTDGYLTCDGLCHFDTLGCYICPDGYCMVSENSVSCPEDCINSAPELGYINIDPIGAEHLLKLKVRATDHNREDILTLSAQLSTGDDLSTIGATFTDHGNRTATLEWTPTLDQVGKYQILFSVADSELLDDGQTVLIFVKEMPDWCEDVDLNCDGEVNTVEWPYYRDYFGQQCNQSNNYCDALFDCDGDGHLNNGDVDHDGEVTTADWSILQENLNRTDCAPDWCQDTDLNCDGEITSFEWSHFDNYFGEQCNQSNNYCDALFDCDGDGYVNNVDFNHDGEVNMEDGDIFQANWPRSDCRPPTIPFIESEDPQKIAAAVLINFANPNIDITSLEFDALSDEQRLALTEALAFLEGMKFLIFNRQVVILNDTAEDCGEAGQPECYGGIDVFAGDSNGNPQDDGDYVWLEVFKQGESLGKILFADLNVLDERETCDANNDRWYDYLYCYLENYSKDNPDAQIGEETVLIDFITGYLDSRFIAQGGFVANFKIINAANNIRVRPIEGNNLDALDRDIMMTFGNDPTRYDKDIVRESLLSAKGSIFDNETDFFFVIEEDISEGIAVSDIKEIADSQLPFTQNMIELAPPQPDPCSYDQAESSVIPCNNRIDFFDYISPWDMALRWFKDVLYYDATKLKKLGYDVKRYKNTNWIGGFRGIEPALEMVNSTGQVMIVSGHGTDDEYEEGVEIYSGYIFPLGCISNTEEKRQAIKDELQAANIFKDNNNLFPNVQFIKGYGCPLGKIGWGINLQDTTMSQKAIQAGTPCHGQEGAVDNALSIYLNPPHLKSMAKTRYDLVLFYEYLLGIGPGKGIGWNAYSAPGNRTNFYDEYPPLQKLGNYFTHNVNLSDINNFGSPCYTMPDEYCLGNEFYWKDPKDSFRFTCDTLDFDPNVSLPCKLEAKVQTQDVHLFPYIADFPNPPYPIATEGNPHGTPEGTQYIDVEFSDNVVYGPESQVTAECILEDGSNAVKAEPYGLNPPPDPDKIWRLELDPEIEFLTYYQWANLDESQKEDIKKAAFKISEFVSRSNGISMVGNPLAELTKKNREVYDEHEEPFWFHDTHFWNYNARAVGKGARGSTPSEFGEFTARIPYMKHPWVMPNSYGGTRIHYSANAIEIKFSSPVNTDGDLCTAEGPRVTVDYGQCARYYDDKPFDAETTVPAFIDDQTLTFRLRRSDRYSRIHLKDLPLNTVWPEDWAVKIKVSGIESKENGYPLQGNAGSPSFWNYDMDGDGNVDAWQGNSSEGLQTKGDFEIWIPCVPMDEYGVCVRKYYRADGRFFNSEVDTSLESDCESFYYDNGAKILAQFKAGKTKLEGHYWGDPTPGGTISGHTTEDCGLISEGFHMEEVVTTSSACAQLGFFYAGETIYLFRGFHKSEKWRNRYVWGESSCSGYYGDLEIDYGDECVVTNWLLLEDRCCGVNKYLAQNGGSCAASICCAVNEKLNAAQNGCVPLSNAEYVSCTGQ